MKAWPRARKIVRVLALLTGYVGLVTWLTWPLAASLRSSMPMTRYACLFDMYYSAWVLAHDSRALLGTGTGLADASIYHPASNSFFYGPAALGAVPLFAPVFLTTDNPGLAIDVTFLLGLALTGVAMHVVVRRWTGSDLAGVVGAATVVVNQWLLWDFVPTSPHWAALYCLPLIAFAAAAPLESLRSAVRLVLLVVLQCLTDLVYVAPAVMAPLGLLAAVRVVRHRSRGAAVRLLAVLAISVAMLLPIYRGYRKVQAENPNLATQTRWPGNESGYIWPFPERILNAPVPFIVTPVAMALIGTGVLALWWRRRSGWTPPTAGGWTHGALWATVGGCLAQHSLMRIGGQVFLTPFGDLARWIPSLQVIRMPSRLGVAGLVGLGILSGVAFGEIAALIRTYARRPGVARGVSTALAVLVLGLVYRAYVGNYGAYMGPVSMPAAYALRAAPVIPQTFLPVLRSSRAPLIELPVGQDGLDSNSHALAMFHAITHQRPVLNGYSSYWPAGFVERMTEAKRLPDRDALDHLVETTGLSVIWLHMQNLTAAEQASWARLPSPEGGRRGLIQIAREGPELLLAVSPAVSGR